MFHLPQYLRHLRHDVDELYKLLQNLNHKVVTNAADINEVRRVTDQLHQDIDRLSIRHTELEHAVATIKRSKPTSTASAAKTETATLFANDHDLDAFYLEFENKFRGSEQEIKQKQKPYIKVFEAAKLDKHLPVADLGCGRGEFLELLTEHGFNAVGVDLNESMVARAQERGFTAVKNDAISYLASQKSGSHAGVTGFHLAEHIPFDQLLILIAEAYRCLAKGGILLLETPNPESLFVGAFTFHYDPSHLKPLPPAIMQFAAQFKGFERAEILRLQPELTPNEIAKATKNTALQNALARLYGPRDYALVAYK